MTQDEIIEMARKAGVEDSNEYDHLVCTEVELVAFAKLIAAKAFPDGVDAEWVARRTRYAVEQEREACAKVCDDKVDAEYATGKVDHNEMGWTQSCAIAIRARGEA